MPIRLWSPLSDDTNGVADIDSGINWEENQPPASVNNTSRSEMAEIRKYYEDISANATSTGTGNAYELATSQEIVLPLLRGDAFIFKTHLANTGPATLNVNVQGGVAWRARDGVEFAAGQLQAGQIVAAYYDGTQFLALGLDNGTVTVDQLDANTRGLLNDIGDVKPWLVDTPPAGWLICDGSAVSRTSFADLFALWGTTFGAGDGSTTFNLADLQDEFLRGVGTATGGVGTKQGDQVEEHQHSSNLTLPQHTHLRPAGGGDYADARTLQDPVGGLQAGSNIATGRAAATGNASTLPSIGGSVGNTSGASAGTETRPQNMAIHWVVLADAAAASGAVVNAAGFSGYGFTFSDETDTSVDPGEGVFTMNGTFATATEIAVDDQTSDTGNADISSVIASWGTAAGADKGTLKITHASSIEIFTQHEVSAVDTAPSGFSKLTIVQPADGSNGAFVDGDPVRFDFIPAAPGATGATGPTGPNLGLDYQFNTATSGDPGSGKVLLNGGGTTVSISKTNRQGKDQSATILTWDDSSNPDDRGHINIVDTADAGSDFLQMHVSGNVTDQTTHFDVPVVQQSAGDAITNDAIVGILFAPAGDKGLDGAGSGDVVGPALSTANAIAGYANTTGKLLQDTPVTVDPGTGNIAGVGTLAASAKVTGLDFAATGTGANSLPVGTTAQEPAAAPGMIRYNTTLARLRAVVNSVWQTVVDLGTVNTWIVGQRKLSDSFVWASGFTLGASLDFEASVSISAGNLPTPDASGFVAGEHQEGTIRVVTTAGTAGLATGWNIVSGQQPDLTAAGTTNLYYRSGKNLAGTEEHDILGAVNLVAAT